VPRGRLNEVGIYSIAGQALDEPAAQLVLANPRQKAHSRTKGGQSHSEVGG